MFVFVRRRRRHRSAAAHRCSADVLSTKAGRSRAKAASLEAELAYGPEARLDEIHRYLHRDSTTASQHERNDAARATSASDPQCEVVEEENTVRKASSTISIPGTMYFETDIEDQKGS